MTKPGILIVISAPSGAGKNTLLAAIGEMEQNLATTISATTRMPRPGEEDGREYHFLSWTDFEARIAAGDFVEWAEVHSNLYGTLKCELDRCLNAGSDVILEVDVQGMRSVRGVRDDVVSIFLMPPSLDELARRLRARGTDEEEVIALRLQNAHAEMAARHEFDYIVVNDDLEHAAADMVAILRAERCRAWRQP